MGLPYLLSDGLCGVYLSLKRFLTRYFGVYVCTAMIFGPFGVEGQGSEELVSNHGTKFSELSKGPTWDLVGSPRTTTESPAPSKWASTIGGCRFTVVNSCGRVGLGLLRGRLHGGSWDVVFA